MLSRAGFLQHHLGCTLWFETPPHHDVATPILHHSDGISQVMYSAWCSTDTVFGLLPKVFNFVSSGQKIFVPLLCLTDSKQVVIWLIGQFLRWLSFYQFLKSLQRTFEALLDTHLAIRSTVGRVLVAQKGFYNPALIYTSPLTEVYRQLFGLEVLFFVLTKSINWGTLYCIHSSTHISREI